MAAQKYVLGCIFFAIALAGINGEIPVGKFFRFQITLNVLQIIFTTQTIELKR
jgi:hypothetical protein